MGSRLYNKNPSTERRVSKANHEAAIEAINALHLRIIEDELSDTVQNRKNEVGGKHSYISPRNKRLLSELLKCAVRLGSLSTVGVDNADPGSCSTWEEAKSCSNSVQYYHQSTSYCLWHTGSFTASAHPLRS